MQPREARSATFRDSVMATGERTALFIDGANLYATAKALGFDVDYRKLLKEYQGRGYLVRAFYYTALAEDQEYSSIRPLIDWLDYNGYKVVTKPVREFTDSLGRRKFKGNMDIELAVDAMELAQHMDHMVLFSGDGDFRSLVEAMQRRGVRVSVVSTVTTQPPMVADDLRRQADEFVDLASMQKLIGREVTDRPVREPGHVGAGGLREGRSFEPRGHEPRSEPRVSEPRNILEPRSTMPSFLQRPVAPAKALTPHGDEN